MKIFTLLAARSWNALFKQEAGGVCQRILSMVIFHVIVGAYAAYNKAACLHRICESIRKAAGLVGICAALALLAAAGTHCVHGGIHTLERRIQLVHVRTVSLRGIHHTLEIEIVLKLCDGLDQYAAGVIQHLVAHLLK